MSHDSTDKAALREDGYDVREETDDEVIGVPNAPYRPPTPDSSGRSFVTARTESSSGSSTISQLQPDVPVTPHSTEKNDDSVIDRARKSGQRSWLGGLLMMSATFVPWTSSLILSWAVFGQTHKHDRPHALYVVKTPPPCRVSRPPPLPDGCGEDKRPWTNAEQGRELHLQHSRSRSRDCDAHDSAHGNSEPK